MKIAVDAMGGDYGHKQIVKEATEARDILVKGLIGGTSVLEQEMFAP